MGSPSVVPRVLDYMKQNANMPLSAQEIAKELDLSPSQVRTAVANAFKRSPETSKYIEVLVKANMWRWVSSGSAKNESHPMFEHVKTLKSGSLLIEDENGVLYIAEKLEK